jgi:NADH:ubiquinone oxidoreductase subunit K
MLNSKNNFSPNFWLISMYILLFNLSFDLLSASSAYAYLDGNTGGIIVQIVMSIFYAIVLGVTIFWRRCTGFLKSLIARFRNNKRPYH